MRKMMGQTVRTAQLALVIPALCLFARGSVWVGPSAAHAEADHGWRSALTHAPIDAAAWMHGTGTPIFRIRPTTPAPPLHGPDAVMTMPAQAAPAVVIVAAPPPAGASLLALRCQLTL